MISRKAIWARIRRNPPHRASAKGCSSFPWTRCDWSVAVALRTDPHPSATVVKPLWPPAPNGSSSYWPRTTPCSLFHRICSAWSNRSWLISADACSLHPLLGSLSVDRSRPTCASTSPSAAWSPRRCLCSYPHSLSVLCLHCCISSQRHRLWVRLQWSTGSCSRAAARGPWSTCSCGCSCSSCSCTPSSRPVALPSSVWSRRPHHRPHCSRCCRTLPTGCGPRGSGRRRTMSGASSGAGKWT